MAEKKETPELLAVTSSVISGVAFNDRENTLQVRFKNGDTWQYENVSNADYQTLMSAESLGAFFASQIKPYCKGVKLG